jgi:2-hydroxychromene-2-carboxylate isomerase
LGADGGAFQEVLDDPAGAERVARESRAAADAGVFGSPYVIVDGEPFWGFDRLDQVARWLETGGW